MIAARNGLKLVRHPAWLAACVAVWCVLASTSQALGWGAVGHRLVGLIAFERMSPQARAKVVAILKNQERYAEDFDAEMPDSVREAGTGTQERWIFSQAAIWPDLVRSDSKQIPGRAQFHRPKWHYIDVPFFLTERDRKILEGNLTENIGRELPAMSIDELLADQELNAVQAMKLAVRILRTDQTTSPQKALAMCWLFHLVGDIHQPLHSTALYSSGRFPKGDRGGNDIPVVQGHNLHSLWDRLPGTEREFNEVRGKAVALLADNILSAAGKKAVCQLDFWAWVEESHALAKRVVYGKSILANIRAGEHDLEERLAPVELSEAYLEHAGHVARARLVEAGYRLAALTEQIVEPTAGSQVPAPTVPAMQH